MKRIFTLCFLIFTGMTSSFANHELSTVKLRLNIHEDVSVEIDRMNFFFDHHTHVAVMHNIRPGMKFVRITEHGHHGDHFLIFSGWLYVDPSASIDVLLDRHNRLRKTRVISHRVIRPQQRECDIRNQGRRYHRERPYRRYR